MPPFDDSRVLLIASRTRDRPPRAIVASMPRRASGSRLLTTTAAPGPTGCPSLQGLSARAIHCPSPIRDPGEPPRTLARRDNSRAGGAVVVSKRDPTGPRGMAMPRLRAAAGPACGWRIRSTRESSKGGIGGSEPSSTTTDLVPRLWILQGETSVDTTAESPEAVAGGNHDPIREEL